MNPYNWLTKKKRYDNMSIDEMKTCDFCGKDLSKWSLDASRLLKCDTCTMRLVTYPEMPKLRPNKPGAERSPLPEHLRVRRDCLDDSEEI